MVAVIVVLDVFSVTCARRFGLESGEARTNVDEKLGDLVG